MSVKVTKEPETIDILSIEEKEDPEIKIQETKQPESKYETITGSNTNGDNYSPLIRSGQKQEETPQGETSDSSSDSGNSTPSEP